ncbi:MAG: hypothetical protein J6Y08_09345 [Clostridiales bacterium]|nr:hypothetical protein [Clostridiales bacterium]
MRKEFTKKVMLAIIVISLIHSVSLYFIAKRVSYSKYLKGEYFFTVVAHADVDQYDLAAAGVKPQPVSPGKEMIRLGSNNAKVYVYDVRDTVCTVIYDDETTLRNFPLRKVRFDSDTDMGYVYGTKKYTSDEYFEKLDSLSKREISSKRISDRAMAGYKNLFEYMIILIGADFVAFVTMIAMWKFELDDAIELVLIFSTAYSLFMDVMIAMNFIA